MIALRYGDETVPFLLDDRIHWQILEKTIPSPELKEEEIVGRAVDDLLQQLADRIKSRQKLLLVVPDHTRRCQLALVLPLLTSALENKFSCRIEILIANGSHALQPEQTIRQLVGDDIYDRYSVQQHDCRDNENLDYFGQTSNGTPVYLNKKIRAADFILTIGGVLYHYFAGFGGGPKMLLPGVAGYETIRLNHRRTIDEKTGLFHPDCHEGNISTNPVFNDLVQIVNFVPNVLSLQLAINEKGRIVAAQAGPILPTHKKICALVEKMYSLPIGYKADVVVASAGGFPSDVNLIQSHKSIHHAFQAVKENGQIIILAECREGIGSKTFMPYFDEGSSAAIGRKLLKDYKINGHTALALKCKTEKSKIILISQLPPSQVRKTGMIPAKDLAQAWYMIAADMVPNATGYIFPNAHIYVPVLTPNRHSDKS